MRILLYFIMMKETIEENKFWDKLGLCTSVLCLIHCITPPILMLYLPVSTFSFLQEEIVHNILSVIVIASIIFAVYPTCKKHEHKDILILAGMGVLFIIAAAFVAHHSNKLHYSFTMLGSLFLIISHVKNIRVRHGKCIESQDCQHSKNK